MLQRVMLSMLEMLMGLIFDYRVGLERVLTEGAKSAIKVQLFTAIRL